MNARLRQTLAVIFVIGISATVAAFSQHDHDRLAPILPERRATRQLPQVLPELPPGADKIMPFTFNVTIRRESAQGRSEVLREAVTRTVDRIHVARDAGPEWLFERNPVDSRRVSGYLIDHASRSIVFHSDSDLRTMLGIPGWGHVLTLGFDPTVLTDLTRLKTIKTIDGVRFAQFSGPRRGSGHGDVWWSEDQILPAEFTTASDAARTRLSIADIRAADEKVLRPPGSRFPDYRMVDLADWLEHR